METKPTRNIYLKLHQYACTVFFRHMTQIENQRDTGY